MRPLPSCCELTSWLAAGVGDGGGGRIRGGRGGLERGQVGRLAGWLPEYKLHHDAS